MSLSHSANIVRDGLTLYLDAGNIKSYPGSGTAWNDLSISGINASGTAANISTTGAIAVTTAGGTGISTSSYTVIPPPTISSFTPSSGVSGTTVTPNV